MQGVCFAAVPSNFLVIQYQNQEQHRDQGWERQDFYLVLTARSYGLLLVNNGRRQKQNLQHTEALAQV